MFSEDLKVQVLILVPFVSRLEDIMACLVFVHIGIELKSFGLALSEGDVICVLAAGLGLDWARKLPHSVIRQLPTADWSSVTHSRILDVPLCAAVATSLQIAALADGEILFLIA